METAKEMRKRHEQELHKLQEECQHLKISDWMDEWWAPAHSTGFQVKICEVCEKIVAHRTKCRKCGKITESYKNGIDTDSRPIGSYYCPDCFERTEAEIKSDEEYQKQLDQFVQSSKKGK